MELPDGQRVMVGDRFERVAQRTDGTTTSVFTVAEVLPHGRVASESPASAWTLTVAVADLLDPQGGWVRGHAGQYAISLNATWVGDSTPREDDGLVFGEGHRVLMSAAECEQMSLVFCAECGRRVRDTRRAVQEGPCDPIRAGDEFFGARGLTARAVERRGRLWLVKASGWPGFTLLPSELAGDVVSAYWTRIPRRSVIHGVGVSVTANQTPGMISRSVGEYLASVAGRPARSAGYPDRSEIDALLREDARVEPDYAPARRAAVMEYADRVEVGDRAGRISALGAKTVLRECRCYEGLRGHRVRPSDAAGEMRASWAGSAVIHALAAYESHRAR